MPDDAGNFKGIFVSKLWPGHPSNAADPADVERARRADSTADPDASPFPKPGIMNGYPLDADEQAAVDRVVANG